VGFVNLDCLGFIIYIGNCLFGTNNNASHGEIHTIYTYNCGLNVKVGRNYVVYCILCVG
jgi:hypothetical protein